MNSVRSSHFDLDAAVEAAEQKRNRGDIQSAYSAYQEIASSRLTKSYGAADLTVLHSLADLAALCGHHQSADDILVSLINLCRQAKNQHRADFAVLNRIHLALDQGHSRRAVTLFQEMAPRIGDIRAIKITPSGLLTWESRCHWPNTDRADRELLLTLLYLEGGRLLSVLGQYKDALEMFNRGLNHATPRDTQLVPALARRQVPWFHLSIARACLESGLLPEAEATLSALKALSNLPKEQSLQIQWHTLAGKLALLQGNLGKALDHFQSILERCHHMKTQRGIGIATLNLAQTLIFLNQNQLAREHLDSISTDIERLQDRCLGTRLALLKQLAYARSQSLVLGSTLLSVSDLLRRSTEEAEANLLQPTENLQFSHSQSSHYLTWFEDRVLEFQWYLSRAELTKAAQQLEYISAVVADTDSQLVLTRLKTLQGILLYYEGVENLYNGDKSEGLQQIRQGAIAIDSVRPALSKMGLKPDQWQAQRVLGWCLMRLNSPSREQDLLATETTKLLGALTDSLAPEQQAIFLLNKWTVEEEYLATQIVRLRRLQKRLRESPWHRRLRLWWRLLQQLNALVNYIDAYKSILAKRTTQSTKSAPLVKYPSLLARLFTSSWRCATLSFLVLPDQIFVVRSWFCWLDFAVVPLTRLELRNLVTSGYEVRGKQNRLRNITLVSELDEIAHSQPFKKDETSAQVIAEKLELSFFLNLPWHVCRLTIVPDDVLHIFPFATVTHKGGYLIESYAVTIAYDMPKVNADRSSAQPKKRTLNKVLLVGVSQGAAQFSALPGVRREIESIYTWFTQKRIAPDILLDNEVEKEKLLSALESSHLLHIACHGFFKHAQAEKSGLVLSPQKVPPDILSLRELASLDLTGLQHVTLSACSSADHLVMPGRWVISLPETLWRAGAPSILGSLWEVYDQFAIAFMTRFYEYSFTKSRDEALRQTQLDCLYGRLSTLSDINVRDPIYWSGFNLYGETKRLR
jgi:tetratricopeptide (TPR) repeat protein